MNLRRRLPLIIFPELPSRPGHVDPAFAEEDAAARAAGFEVRLYSDELVNLNQSQRAIRRIPVASESEEKAVRAPVLLRGWMLTETNYASLAAALVKKGYEPINDGAGYAEAHYLPLAYTLLRGHTPESFWTDNADLDAAWDAYLKLREGDVIVKDWVKSAKNRWEEACFIPAGSDRARAEKTLRALMDDRGRLFERGFVFRRFVPLVSNGRNMRGHPADREVRLFLLNGEILVQPQPRFLPPPELLNQYCEIARLFRSRFMSMDIAETSDGGWTIIEVGDGGVSGLPVSLMEDTFYEGIARVWRG